MSELLKITKDSLSSIFSTIKDNVTTLATSIAQTKADEKDRAIIAAALIGKEVEYTTLISNRIPSARRPIGTFIGNAASVLNLTRGNITYYYFYSDSAAPMQVTVENLKTILTNYYTYNSSPYRLVSSSSWSTLTPIKDADGQISAIYKGETVGNFTKWIIIFNTGTNCETEDQLYYARSSSNSSLVYGKYQYKYPFTTYFNAPWELWLPKSAAAGSVVIAY